MSLYTINAGIAVGGQPPVIVTFHFDEEGWQHQTIAGYDTWVGTPGASWDDIPQRSHQKCSCQCEVRGYKTWAPCECGENMTCQISGTDLQGPYECHSTCR